MERIKEIARNRPIDFLAVAFLIIGSFTALVGSVLVLFGILTAIGLVSLGTFVEILKWVIYLLGLLLLSLLLEKVVNRSTSEIEFGARFVLLLCIAVELNYLSVIFMLDWGFFSRIWALLLPIVNIALGLYAMGIFDSENP